MSLAAGSRLGPYEIQSPLGAGGMGEVYRARDTRLERTVAIKILPDTLAADPQFRERFDREARTISQLDHPHICALYDVGEQAGTAYLVMQYLEGETLAARLERGGISVSEALTVAMQISAALDAAHHAGIVHRDLKPGNVMLTKACAKLLDFGLAKASAPAVAAAGVSVAPTMGGPVTTQGTILGTFQYMAPEQLEGKDADARTDIFAFGAVLYEMLTGRKAFEGQSHASLVAAILEREPAPISSLQPLTPSALNRIVRKCLAKDPERRWQTARDLHDELQWVTESGTPPAAAAAAGAAPAKRQQLPLAAAAAASLALGAAAMALYWTVSAPAPLPAYVEISTPPTAEPLSFALSPDGRQLAFVASDERGSGLWIRSLDRATATLLPGTEGATDPFWAPDSRALGFFAAGKLHRIDLVGGARATLGDAPISRGGTWSRDGTIVFVANTTDGILRVPASGGTPEPVIGRVAGQGAYVWPQFLPDGRQFLFTLVAAAPDVRGAYLASIDGGSPRRISGTETSATYAPPGYLLTLSEGLLAARRVDPQGAVSSEATTLGHQVGSDPSKLRSAVSVADAGVLAYRSGTVGAREMVWVDRSGKTIGTLLPAEETGLVYPELSPDGERASVFRPRGGSFDTWIVDVRRGASTRLTFDPAVDVAAVWSPDGRRIVFASNRTGTFELYEKPSDASADERPLATGAGPKQTKDWRADGRFILYAQQDLKTASDLWALPMEGDAKPFPVVQTAFDEVHGQFSPDGRWVAYATNETGRYEIYVRPFPEGGGRWQVSAAGGIYPRWARDGKELFYIAPDNALMAAPVRAGVDGRTFAVESPINLFRTQLATGGNVGIGGFASASQYDVAADGRFLMNVVASDAAVSPITLILNWTALLPR